MAKVNFLQMVAKQEARTFETVLPGGEVFVLSLRPLNDSDEDAIAEKVSALCDRYINGGWTNDEGEKVDTPDVLTLPEGADVSLSRRLFVNAVMLEVSQPRWVEDRYTALDFVVASGVPGSHAYNWAKERLDEVNSKTGEATGPSGGPVLQSHETMDGTLTPGSNS